MITSGAPPSSCARDLRAVVERAAPALEAMSDDESARRPAPGKWSAREIVGHLIDSASNNHQRFVRAIWQDDLVFPTYDQDAWVGAQRYQEAPWPELVGLWRAFNLHLARVMESVPEEVRTREHRRHNLDRVAWKTVPADEAVTLDYFMRDYVGHLEHHLGQIAPRIVPFRREYRADFERLNLPWLEEHALLEASDVAQLRDPEGAILATGGEILFLVAAGAVVGTCSLKRDARSEYGPASFELVKLAVDRAARGRGYGDLLVRAALAAARARGARVVYLYSSSRLGTALRLYERLGFVLVRQGAAASRASGYETCDVEMVLDLGADAG